MGKTNWKRVFLGGLVAGVVAIVVIFAAYGIYLEKLTVPAMEALGLSTQASVGQYILDIVKSLVGGILVVWLYSAIRLRYGAGPRTAVIAGLILWIIGNVFPATSLGSAGLFPSKMLVANALTGLMIWVVAAQAGAWVYKGAGIGLEEQLS